ncbi:hypothetical protein [Sinomonas atrocyanea]|uniref:hypothetical protein n=1 Tax=Sinomonas atrocyanea TaxID=37927 RepID=UPI00285B364E|nr:hypothetical protein [Sinomonas atrocyanea]MDR6620784.1 hypothetical protein [Sinomonas atrocyanea]
MTARPKAYTDEDLATIIEGLKDRQGRALTVIPAAQINQGMIVAKQAIKSAVITPSACAALATSNAQVPDGATYAAGQSVSAADHTATVITAISVEDPAQLAGQAKQSADALAQCSTFTMEISDQTVTTQVRQLSEVTRGDRSVGSLIIQTLPTGQKQTTLTVTGVKGNLGATAVKTGATVTTDSAAELVELVNSVLG